MVCSVKQLPIPINARDARIFLKALQHCPYGMEEQLVVAIEPQMIWSVGEREGLVSGFRSADVMVEGILDRNLWRRKRRKNLTRCLIRAAVHHQNRDPPIIILCQ